MDLIIIIFFSNVWEKMMNGIKKYQINMKIIWNEFRRY